MFDKPTEVSTKDGDTQSQQQDSQPLTQADAKHFATETGTENGLVLDDYVQKHLRPEKAKQLNTLAKALGVRVRFVNSIRGGTANASIRGNEVRIERYNPNPVTFLLGHELTHRMQSLSPEAYARFKEAIRPEVEKEAQGLHSLYRIRGENIDFEGAIDEATANYAGRLLEKGPVLDEFIQRHKTDRTLLEKVLDAVRDILSKLTGQERKQAETAEAKLLAAMEETAETVKKNGNQTADVESEVENYSLKGKEFTEDKYYSRLMDKWSELPANSRVKVGKLREGSALAQVGIPASGMYFDVGKIRKAMEVHDDHLTAGVMKGIPDLLNDPIVITEYTGPDGTIKNTINVYGNLFIGGTPVVVGVVMHRDINGQAIISNIRTIHARSDFAKQITDQSVLYLNEDKKQTRSWFQVCGNLNVPLEGTKYGLIRSITFNE